MTIRPIEHYTARNGFSDEIGALNPEPPRSNLEVSFVDMSTHTLVQTEVTYESPDDLETVIRMGM